MFRICRVILSMGALVSMTACAPLAALLGFSGPAIQIASQLDQVKLAADGVSFVRSGKTISDHVLSAATGSDCKLVNVLDHTPVCVDPSPAKPAGLVAN